MKKLRLLSAALLSTTLLSAQVRMAAVGGVQASTVNDYWTSPEHGLSKTQTARTGMHIGFLAEIPLVRSGRWVLQPGMMYVARGASQKHIIDTAHSAMLVTTEQQSVNYVDLPFHLLYKLPLSPKVKLVLGAGPQLSLFYSGATDRTALDTLGEYGSSKVEDLPVGKEDGQFAVFHGGMNGLAGFEFRKLFLHFKYNRGLTPYFKKDGREFTHTSMGASLGIYLGKQAPVAPKDRDEDGIPDAQDGCPALAGSALTGGCPDGDGDGLADARDACPTEAGTSNLKGCPLRDRDGDAVPDAQDGCPDVAGLAVSGGCPPPDRDGDGIPDSEDGCADQYGLLRLKGCPPADRDGDGIPDENDRCPEVAGQSTHGGCPEVRHEVVEKVAYAARSIQFESASAQLKPVSRPVLDELVRLLQSEKSLKITVEGHTSADGNPLVNQKLSTARAEAVRTYLVQKGISPDRILAIGLGSSQPVNEGRTVEERAQNRRVELKLNY